MKLLIGASITIALLSGCSTKIATSTSTVSPTLYGTATADSALITVTRDSGIVGAACAAKLSIDNKVVAKLKPSDSVKLNVPSGRHILSFDTRGGLCPSVSDAVEVTLNKGDDKRYRIRADTNGNFQLLPTL